MVTCSTCATSVQDPPLTWTMEVTERGRIWTCEVCARDNLRAIEAKLDRRWW